MQNDFRAFADRLSDLERRQLPFAVRRTLSDCAVAARDKLKQALPTVFDRPTPFAMNAFYAKPATGKAGLAAEAFVGVRDFAGKGTPASKFLAPEIRGGGRGVKRFERRVDGVAGTAGGQLIPAHGASLDRFGNADRKMIGQVLAHLRAFDDTGQNVGPRALARLEKRKLLTNTSRGRAKYFIGVSKKDGRPVAIYNVLGRGIVVPVFFFPRRAPTYRPRLDFYGLSHAAYRETFAPRLAVRFAEAWATRRA